MAEVRRSQSSTGESKWGEIWRLCEEARKLEPDSRQDYLRSKGVDPAIERDVISLLGEPEESVTSSWTVRRDTDLGSITPRDLAGSRVGRYVVGDLVGKGGGGEVHTAKDTDLGRTVALKFLHPGRAGDRAIHRFLREAKAASALNHPGIITVYEVIQSESGLAIAMELVDGRALRSLCGTPNPASQVMQWGEQIADALAVAHANGIIHRDIKPENLMLRGDGFVKVLDFGLAQNLTGLQESLGNVLPEGTVRYMSPEQATGEKLTPATDVFSLGIVLYELVTGKHPFLSESQLGTLQAIVVNRPAAPSTVVRDMPGALESLILRMLEKNPALRPTAAEVAALLDRTSGPAQPSRSPLARMAAGVLLILALVAAGYFVWTRSHYQDPISLSPIPLTDTPGVDSFPDISPDGESIVYGWGMQENSYTHLLVKRLDRDDPVKLLEAEHGERVSNPRWSPDGSQILFKSSAPGLKYAIWTVNKDGSGRRKLRDLGATDHSSGLDWSPDGRQIAFTDVGEGRRYEVHLLDLSTMADRVITVPPAGIWGDWDPRFSRDGSTIAFKRVAGLSNDQIFLVPVEGGTPVQITTGRHGISGHTFLPDGRLLVAGRFESSVYGLWSMDAKPGATPQLVHRSSLDEVMPTSRKNRVAWVNRLDDHNIYAVPLAGGTPTRWIASAMYDSRAVMARDGRMAFVSRRSGDSELWISGNKGADAVRVTSVKAEIPPPAWSPDGSRLVFSIEGQDMIYMMDCEQGQLRCGTPKPLTQGVRPVWTSDGRYIYYAIPPSGDIYRLAVSGGQPEPIGAAGRDPVVSVDGKWLYYRQINGGIHLARRPLGADGTPSGPDEVLVDRMKSSNREHWTVTGDEVIYWDNDTDSIFSGLKAYHTVTRKTRIIVEAPAMYPSVSPDRSLVFFSKRDRSGVNVVVADIHR